MVGTSRNAPTSTVTQIEEDCTNIPRQAIIHCVSTRFSTLMSFAYSKSSLVIEAIFLWPFFERLSWRFFVRLLYVICKTRHGWKFNRFQIIFDLIPFGKWCFHNVVRSLHFVSFQWCKTAFWPRSGILPIVMEILNNYDLPPEERSLSRTKGELWFKTNHVLNFLFSFK